MVRPTRNAARGYTVDKEIRKSVIAGTWYPGDPATLAGDIRNYLQKVPAQVIGGPVVGLISPHAGYVYSGQIAAYGYRLIEGQRYDAVVVIGPSHRVMFHGASVWTSGGYETPLGVVPVDKELAGAILEVAPVLKSDRKPHAGEHSVEIQLPFLQVVLGSFVFVPIVMGTQDHGTCEAVAEAIFRAAKGKNVLVVGSSDLSHFHTYEEAKRLDQTVVDLVQKGDHRGLSRELEGGTCEACGGGPVITAMLYAEKTGARGVKVLKYANSGDVTGDWRQVVGYLSAAFFRENPGKKGIENKRVGVDMGLTEDEKQALLRIARASIAAEIEGKKPPALKRIGALDEKRGAFVCLKIRNRLRGCIGFIEAKTPLAKTVEEMSIAAALRDPRFPPLRKEELKDVQLEISVLTPLRRIADVAEIEVGTHGLYIRKGGSAGLLLPQVATEYGWDRGTFLKETCRKAGLGPDAWRDPETEIYIFSADVFGED
jgi:AmmeMemoRadiSam system protein B/AmmeMemoRadiSam system protein A